MKKKTGLPKVRNPLPAPMMKRPIKEGRGEKPDTSKPDIDGGKWEKEFEDEIGEDSEYGFINIYDKNDEIDKSGTRCKLKGLIERYLGKIWLDDKNGKTIRTSLKVKIKCKDGCIQIERVGQ